MADGLLCNESPIEFFKAQVEGAMERQRLKTPSGRPTTSSRLLTDVRGRARQLGAAPGRRAARACGWCGRCTPKAPTQREELRSIGDASLFLVGFFAGQPPAPPRRRRLLHLARGIRLRHALRKPRMTRSRTCSARWPASSSSLTDVLAEVSERARLTSQSRRPADLRTLAAHKKPARRRAGSPSTASSRTAPRRIDCSRAAQYLRCLQTAPSAVRAIIPAFRSGRGVRAAALERSASPVTVLCS